MYAEILEFLSSPRSVDDIAAYMGMSLSKAGCVLTSMELRNLVRRLPREMYERYDAMAARVAAEGDV